MKTSQRIAIVLTLGVLLGAGFALSPFFGDGDPIPFTDVKAQAHRFIEWESSIELTDAQELVKKEALEALPAPCCSDNTAYTCCCPCNMSLSIWGLSNRLIAEHGYNAEQVREKVKSWIATINPDGFSGRVCYTAGGCPKPFAEGGCGGMVRGKVSWGE
ncbi:MAG: hypothetical protein AAF481_07775 [Acidobacteriota bacterium]